MNLLADGHWVSGETIAKSFNISRSGVWKRLQTLVAYGLHVESVKGKGYRLAQPLDLMSVAAIRQALTVPAQRWIGQLELLFETPSTNRYLAENKLAAGSVCLAEYQSSGKGRRGRQWQSPLGANLMMSVAWSFAGGASALEGLSLAVGVAVADALLALGFAGAQLKWPNDIVCQQKKLGGILIELSGDASGDCDVVVGLGLNVAMSRFELVGKAIDQPWTDLSQQGLEVSRSRLAAEVLNHVMPLLASYERSGFAAYHERWMSLNAHHDQLVSLRSAAQVVEGRCVGISSAGALLLETAAGRQAFSGGEVSLRLGASDQKRGGRHD